MLFKDDDAAYLDWLNAHPDGYVVNLSRSLSGDYAVLHRAQCGGIRSEKVKPGAYTERGYVKLCGVSIVELRRLMSEVQGRPDADFSKTCGNCCP
ncbi:hypothetical protein NX862_16840 [Rhodobacter sp. KR11]|uniref:hypothetical protein n=1 Tax=Rhodobacter sp. KR11 TaxID=2974588 RepID=UPI002222EB3C|nr:hypothetical protein [Rhodobacter sp. KR11]MCW1920431.1 hypothetical protein [Rhodobacter sp. KR11]